MEQFSVAEAEEASPAKKRLSMAIQTVAKQQAVSRMFAEKHFEQEGADAVLFRDVPKWVSFERISGYRYRKITALSDSGDEFDTYQAGVQTFGFPGVSGWADSIGDVAIHYLGHSWAIFSKIFPFEEQADARAAHEDVLLLGSTKHVMLTPVCAYRIQGAGGLFTKDAGVTCLTCESSLVQRKTTVSKLPKPVTQRLYLTWGHEASDYVGEVNRYHFDLSTLVETAEHETLAHKANRFIAGVASRLASGGKIKVEENWMRYPAQPLVPSYYAQLLATASQYSEEEKAARELIEPRATPRGDAGEVTVDISVLDGNSDLLGA